MVSVPLLRPFLRLCTLTAALDGSPPFKVTENDATTYDYFPHRYLDTIPLSSLALRPSTECRTPTSHPATNGNRPPTVRLRPLGRRKCSCHPATCHYTCRLCHAGQRVPSLDVTAAGASADTARGQPLRGACGTSSPCDRVHLGRAARPSGTGLGALRARHQPEREHRRGVPHQGLRLDACASGPVRAEQTADSRTESGVRRAAGRVRGDAATCCGGEAMRACLGGTTSANLGAPLRPTRPNLSS